MSVPKALTIAGSDSGGGAGIQADLKTFSAFRVFGMSVLTAITAQNSVGVHGVHDVPPAFVGAQIDAVLDDFGTDAIKVGMLSSVPIVGAVAAGLGARGGRVPVVLDPVMVATVTTERAGVKASGALLLQPDARGALTKRMLPLAFVVTPNLPEAAVLAEMAVETEKDMEEAARRIHRLGPRHVLVKGGHLPDAATDLLFDGQAFTRLTGERIPSTNTHGTGCTFSSAIAAGLAHGRALDAAVREAKAYVAQAIREGFRPGRGIGVLRHFVERW
jgi:hydroxymethylpyrimidine/phosphomethylpyrimidine kinase